MFVSFGHRLRGLGNMRLGFRMKGSNGCFYACLFGCINATLYILWFSLLAVLWLIYGMCYGVYWLVKGIVKLCKNKKRYSSSYDCGSGETSNKKDIICWVCVGVFALMAISAISTLSLLGFLGALIFLLGGVVVAPVAVLQNLKSRFNINNTISIVLAVALLIVGVLVTPTTNTDKVDSGVSNPSIEQPQNSEKPSSSGTTNPPNTSTEDAPSTDPAEDGVSNTPADDNTSSGATDDNTSDDSTTQMVYFTSTGAKYHSSKKCPGLSNAKNIFGTDIETAKNKGLSPCSKCH